MDLEMTSVAEAYEVASVMCATICKRSDVMHLGCPHKMSVLSAYLTVGELDQMLLSCPLPFVTGVSCLLLLGSLCVVLVTDNLEMLGAVSSVCQILASGPLAWVLRFVRPRL